MSQLTIVLILLVLVILAFASSKIPFSIIGVSIPVILVATQILTPAEAFAGYINNVLILIIAMFVIGKGLMKTGIVEWIESFARKYSDNQKLVLAVLLIAVSFLAILGSAAGAVAILMPVVLISAEAIHVSRSKFLLPVAIVANIATASTILGQGALNLQWNEVMMNLGGTTPLTWVDFFLTRLPFIVVSFVYALLVAPKLCPDIPNSEFSTIVQSNEIREPVPRAIRTKAIIICSLTIACMIVLDYFGIMKMYLVACIGAMLLVLTGVLSEKEAVQSINWSSILMVGGMLALATAMSSTGAAQLVGEKISMLLGNTKNPFILSFVFFIVPFILTQVMNNAACVSVFVPLCSSVSIAIGADPRAAVLLCCLASCSSFLTPMASTLMAIVAPEGKYTIGNLLKVGGPLAILLILIATFLIPIMYPFF